eukprot:TRINITY_DN4137_c0_g1_i3.p1 TRINITY_DN4137_c0_g1~~TRINITY_DN4137_c0_g1_i3.p1  ORF type:complete len:168 (-),score=14.43 TRINITY_DN4137_c0_g1_i3:103-606(-)
MHGHTFNSACACNWRQGCLYIVFMQIRKVTGEELEVLLAERDRPMIIDFYADWCGPCVLLASELEKVADHYGDKVSICKVDTDDETALASQLQIQGLPTMVFVGMDPNKPALRTEGLLPFQSISEIINNELLQPNPQSSKLGTKRRRASQQLGNHAVTKHGSPSGVF